MFLILIAPLISKEKIGISYLCESGSRRPGSVGDFSGGVLAVVSVEVLLELVAARAGVVTLRALEGFVLKVDALVTHQVALLQEAPAAGGARVRPHPHVRPHVRAQLRALRRRVPTLRVRTLVHLACNTKIPHYLKSNPSKNIFNNKLNAS